MRVHTYPSLWRYHPRETVRTVYYRSRSSALLLKFRCTPSRGKPCRVSGKEFVRCLSDRLFLLIWCLKALTSSVESILNWFTGYRLHLALSDNADRILFMESSIPFTKFEANHWKVENPFRKDLPGSGNTRPFRKSETVIFQLRFSDASRDSVRGELNFFSHARLGSVRINESNTEDAHACWSCSFCRSVPTGEFALQNSFFWEQSRNFRTKLSKLTV